MSRFLSSVLNCKTQLPRIKTKVYVKPTNTGLLLHYQSHVDNRYKRSLITTMLDRAYRISSDWSYFSQECDRLETVFLKLKYPRHLFNLAVKQFLDSKVADQQQIPSTDTTPAPIRVVIPFKDQVSANIIMILIIGFTCPPLEHLFQVYYKVRWSVIAKGGVITK